MTEARAARAQPALARAARAPGALEYCLILLALPLAANGRAAPNAQDLARCAAVSAADARLACYDALANRPPDAASVPQHASPAPSASAPPPSASPARAAAPPASAAPARAAPASATPPSADDPSQFGLSAVQRHVAEVGPKQEQAQIVSLSSDSMGHAVIGLDSGQTWAVTDDDGRLSNGDKVVIKRATLGSFLLTTPSHHTYRVHRLQ